MEEVGLDYPDSMVEIVGGGREPGEAVLNGSGM